MQIKKDEVRDWVNLSKVVLPENLHNELESGMDNAINFIETNQKPIIRNQIIGLVISVLTFSLSNALLYRMSTFNKTANLILLAVLLISLGSTLFLCKTLYNKCR